MLSLFMCTQAEKGQNNTICVLSLFKCTQTDNGQNNTISSAKMWKNNFSIDITSISSG